VPGADAAFDGGEAVRAVRAWACAVPVALVAVTFGALGVAQASFPTTICMSSMLECSIAQSYPANTPFKAELEGATVATFDYAAGPVECETSKISGETTARKGAPLIVDLAEVMFDGCTGVSACEIFVYDLPYDGALTTTGTVNGVLRIEDGGAADPSLKIACLNSCIFGASVEELTVQGGSPATMAAVDVPMQRLGGSQSYCGPTAEWSASYEIVSPDPAYITRPGF
jgi:hypothetical protein